MATLIKFTDIIGVGNLEVNKNVDIKFSVHVSGITFIRYAQHQKIEKPKWFDFLLVGKKTCSVMVCCYYIN